jgi:hypothetical protein
LLLLVLAEPQEVVQARQKARNRQKLLLLVLKAAVGANSPCMANWDAKTYPCYGDANPIRNMNCAMQAAECGTGWRLPCRDDALVESMWLTECNLTGTLPSGFGAWGVTMSRLYLNENPGLVGTIPCSWANLPLSEVLNIGNTNLQGCFPSAGLDDKASGDCRYEDENGVCTLFGYGDRGDVSGVRGECLGRPLEMQLLVQSGLRVVSGMVSAGQQGRGFGCGKRVGVACGIGMVSALGLGHKGGLAGISQGYASLFLQWLIHRH